VNIHTGEHGGDSEDFIAAFELRADNQHLGLLYRNILAAQLTAERMTDLRIKRELCHHCTESRQFTFIIKGSKIVK
jgi:hypothetical protein